MAKADVKQRLRELPSIDELLGSPELQPVLDAHPRERKVAALRLAVGAARDRILRGDERGFERTDVEAALKTLSTPGLRRVLNATGTVLHTNLGRAPLAKEAIARVAEIARGYSNLEFDLDEGERGSRYAPVVGLLRSLTAAEDAIVVNNCAAATLLVLSALAQGREVIVSRGELVEIGGGFRVPDVMRQSGAALIEVGTTNRTRLSDYENALTDRTALLTKIHRSNFAMVGFTEETSVADLAILGRRRQVPLFHDLGSGNLLPLQSDELRSELTVRSSIQAGADLVAFSGDKLLGGPQAGVIVGRAELIALVRRHPLNRALRVDKLTVAALEATLELYRDGREAEVPTRAMLQVSAAVLRQRAERLASLLGAHNVSVTVEEVKGQVGGGALPLAEPVSYACAVPSQDPQGLQDRLRRAEPPVIARVAEGRLILDVRCLEEEDLGAVALAAVSARQD
ncbi:MAG: L-seryl-tRNA(Sec) selenium transferase [Myxococcaceae bacterium]